MLRRPTRPLGAAIALLFVAQLLAVVTTDASSEEVDGDPTALVEDRTVESGDTSTTVAADTTLPPETTTTAPLDLGAVVTAPPAATNRPPATTTTAAPAPPAPAPDVGGATPPSGCGAPILKADGSPWQCTFVEDFEGTTLDRSKWDYQLTSKTGFTFSGDCYTGDPRTHVLGGGVIQLKSIDVPQFNCQSNAPSGRKNFVAYFQSGMITTIGKWSQAFGRWEIRAKLPALDAKGLQTSFWLWPDDPNKYGTWPTSGEIDIMEWYSRFPDLAVPHFHYHAGDSEAAQTQSTYGCAPFKDVSQEEWHTYVLEWTRTHLIVTVDGKPCLSNRINALALQAPAPFDQPFSLSFTQGIGSGGNAHTPGVTQLPAVTTIDYVRVWK